MVDRTTSVAPTQPSFSATTATTASGRSSPVTTTRSRIRSRDRRAPACGAAGRAWTVSWISMNRNDQNPGRGSGRRRAHRKPVNVTAAAMIHPITPAARIHGVDPDSSTTRPEEATSTPNPTRSAQTAILQWALACSSGGSTMPRLCHVRGRATRVLRLPGSLARRDRCPPRWTIGNAGGSTGWPYWSVRRLPPDGSPRP